MSTGQKSQSIKLKKNISAGQSQSYIRQSGHGKDRPVRARVRCVGDVFLNLRTLSDEQTTRSVHCVCLLCVPMTKICVGMMQSS